MSDNTLRGANMAQSILRLPAVMARTGLSRSTIYLWMSQQRFPQAIPLGEHSVGWLDSDIYGWLQARIARCRQAASTKTNQQLRAGAHGGRRHE
jgi:prophage regulatory protein